MERIHSGTFYDLYNTGTEYLLTISANPEEIIWRFSITQTRHAFAWWSVIECRARLGSLLAKHKRS